MAIFSCKGCVPPKRHPGCHDHCEAYQEEKAEYEKLVEAERKRRNMSVYSARTEKVEKAYKKNGGKYGVGF